VRELLGEGLGLVVRGKVAGLEVTGTTLKVQAVEDLEAQYPLSLLLQVAHLPRSTFYDHRNRLARADRHAELKEAIGQTFEDARRAFGHRRILAILLRRGWRVSKKTVAAGPSPSVQMVTDGLRTAIDSLQSGEKPLVHSDQGFQYRHPLWQEVLREAGSATSAPTNTSPDDGLTPPEHILTKLGSTSRAQIATWRVSRPMCVPTAPERMSCGPIKGRETAVRSVT
jgi:hypothetical protein